MSIIQHKKILRPSPIRITLKILMLIAALILVIKMKSPNFIADNLKLML